VRPYLEKPLKKKWLVEWLKVKVLSSNPSTEKREKKMCLSVSFSSISSEIIIGVMHIYEINSKI
jgi:hypothetical protein